MKEWSRLDIVHSGPRRLNWFVQHADSRSPRSRTIRDASLERGEAYHGKPFIRLFQTPNGYYALDVNKNEFIPISRPSYQYLREVMLDGREERALKSGKAVLCFDSRSAHVPKRMCLPSWEAE